MNRILQMVFTALALAGTYCAIATAGSSVGNSGTPRMDKAVIFADGSDPMPMCITCKKAVSN
jgi:hypothetical protein